jgi:hypothetical protein
LIACFVGHGALWVKRKSRWFNVLNNFNIELLMIEGFICNLSGLKSIEDTLHEEDADPFSYFPVKKQRLGIDREMDLYDSIYPAEAKTDPLIFLEKK